MACKRRGAPAEAYSGKFGLDIFRIHAIIQGICENSLQSMNMKWACSSAGRAFGSHPRGREFESLQVHQVRDNPIKFGLSRTFYAVCERKGALLIFGFALPNKKNQKVRGNIKGLSIHRFTKQPQQKR